VFSRGRAQTVPAQPLSCHGTRIVMWCVGRRRAPVASDFMLSSNQPFVGVLCWLLASPIFRRRNEKRMNAPDSGADSLNASL
jgi:hypothetical protein